MRSGVLAVQLLGPQPWHASLFYFLVAPLVQSSSPGVYFDPDTLDALVDNDGSGNATFVPCSVTGCGRFASCADNGANTPCTCSSADTQPTSDFATSRACVPAVASTEQQRVFWTLSMFAFGCGFVLCLFVMNGELHQRTLTHCTPIPLPSAHPSVAPQACKLTSSRLHIVVTQSLCATLSSPSAADKVSGRMEPSLFLTLFSRQRTEAKRRPNERKHTHLPSATLVL